MSTDRPDDRADAVIEQAAKVVRGNTCCSGLCADGTSQRTARALHDAGLLATPADQDNAELAAARANSELLHRAITAEAERDQLRALVVEAGLETYAPDGSERVAAHLTEQQRIITGLRAQVAAVRELADEWEDDGPGCQLWPAYRRLRAALDTAGGGDDE